MDLPQRPLLQQGGGALHRRLGKATDATPAASFRLVGGSMRVGGETTSLVFAELARPHVSIPSPQRGRVTPASSSVPYPRSYGQDVRALDVAPWDRSFPTGQGVVSLRPLPDGDAVLSGPAGKGHLGLAAEGRSRHRLKHEVVGTMVPWIIAPSQEPGGAQPSAMACVSNDPSLSHQAPYPASHCVTPWGHAH